MPTERPIDVALRIAKARGWNQTAFGQVVGASPAAVSNWKSRGLPPEQFEVVAAALNISIDQLIGRVAVPEDFDDVSNVDVAPPLKASRAVPLVGEVKGGPDGFLEETHYPVGHGEGFVDYPTADANAYALRVRGDSMHPRYRAGEFVVVEPSIEPQQGDDVVVRCLDGRKLLKELGWRRNDELQLRSINDGFEPLTLLLADIDSIHLVAGRARSGSLRLHS